MMPIGQIMQYTIPDIHSALSIETPPATMTTDKISGHRFFAARYVWPTTDSDSAGTAPTSYSRPDRRNTGSVPKAARPPG